MVSKESDQRHSLGTNKRRECSRKRRKSTADLGAVLPDRDYEADFYRPRQCHQIRRLADRGRASQRLRLVCRRPTRPDRKRLSEVEKVVNAKSRGRKDAIRSISRLSFLATLR